MKMMSEERVTISKTEYKELLHASAVLNALYGGGVDNWDGYEWALENLEDDLEDSEDD